MKSNLMIDQFATRQIPPAAARELAHRALEDPELFDALVARGAVEASIDAPAVQVALSVPTRRRQWTVALCAVAATWLLAIFVWRTVVSRQCHQPAQQAVAIVPKPRVLPSINVADQAGRPILMASELSPTRAAAAPVLRGDSASNRVPQSSGLITALADGEATVNLGSFDGLAKGTELGA